MTMFSRGSSEEEIYRGVFKGKGLQAPGCDLASPKTKVTLLGKSWLLATKHLDYKTNPYL